MNDMKNNINEIEFPEELTSIEKDIEAFIEDYKKASYRKPNVIGYKKRWYKLINNKYEEIDSPMEFICMKK